MSAANSLLLSLCLLFSLPALARESAEGQANESCTRLLSSSGPGHADHLDASILKPAAARLTQRHYERFARQMRELVGPEKLRGVKFTVRNPLADDLRDEVDFENFIVFTSLPVKLSARQSWVHPFVRAAHEVGHLVLTQAIQARFPELLAEFSSQNGNASARAQRLAQLNPQFQEFFADLFAGIFHRDWNAIGEAAEPRLANIAAEMQVRRCDYEIPDHTRELYGQWYDGDRHNVIRYYQLQPTKNLVSKRAPALQASTLEARKLILDKLLKATVEAMAELLDHDRFDVEKENETLSKHLRSVGLI